MKRFWQLALIILFLFTWVWMSDRKDQLDSLMYHAEKLRSAMSNTFQITSKGALLAKSAEGQCWLAFNDLSPDVARYSKGEDALLNQDLISVKQLAAIIKDKGKAGMVLTSENISSNGIRLKVKKLVDFDTQNSRMILVVEPMGQFKECTRKLFKSPTAFLLLD